MLADYADYMELIREACAEEYSMHSEKQLKRIRKDELVGYILELRSREVRDDGEHDRMENQIKMHEEEIAELKVFIADLVIKKDGG